MRGVAANARTYLRVKTNVFFVNAACFIRQVNWQLKNNFLGFKAEENHYTNVNTNIQ